MDLSCVEKTIKSAEDNEQKYRVTSLLIEIKNDEELLTTYNVRPLLALFY